LTATTDANFLRIGAEEFRSVMKNDVNVLYSLLQKVGHNLTGTADLLRRSDVVIPQQKEAVKPLIE